MVLLSTNDIARLLQDRWGIRGEAVSVVPGTSKVFRVETSEQQYYARLSFSRRDFSADQVVEFINFLGNWGAAVPVIIPTKDGQLAEPIGNRCLSVERALPGTMCDSTCLSILPEAGKQLAKFHDISVHFPGSLREKRPVRDFVGPRLRSVLRSRTKIEIEDRLDGSTVWITSLWSERDGGRVIRNLTKYEVYMNGELTTTELFDYNERFYDTVEFEKMLLTAGFMDIQTTKAYGDTEPSEHDIVVFSCRKNDVMTSGGKLIKSGLKKGTQEGAPL